MCQFLPQEKVQSFSTMTATQLLEETERSVGDSHLLEYHLKLKKIREQQSKVETNLTSITKCRENFQQKYNGIKDTVGQIQERKRVQNRIQAMKQKRAWVLYGEKMDAFKAVSLLNTINFSKISHSLNFDFRARMPYLLFKTKKKGLSLK